MSSYLGAISSQALMLTLTGRPGDWCTRTDQKATYQLAAADPSQAGNWYQILFSGARTTTVASTAAPAPNADTDDIYTVTALAVTAAVAAPTGTPVNGQHLTVRIKDSGTIRTLSWNAAWRGIGTALPTATVVGQTLYVWAVYNSTDAKWDALRIASG